MHRVVELTTGNESQLTKFIQSGDVSRAVQLANAAILAVDKDRKVQPVTQERLKEKRKQVINKFSAFLSTGVTIRFPVAQVSIACRKCFVIGLNNSPPNHPIRCKTKVRVSRARPPIPYLLKFYRMLSFYVRCGFTLSLVFFGFCNTWMKATPWREKM